LNFDTAVLKEQNFGSLSLFCLKSVLTKNRQHNVLDPFVVESSAWK